MAEQKVRVVWVDVMMVVAAIILVVAVIALQEASQMATAGALTAYMIGVVVLAIVSELTAVSAERKSTSL